MSSWTWRIRYKQDWNRGHGGPRPRYVALGEHGLPFLTVKPLEADEWATKKQAEAARIELPPQLALMCELERS